MINDSVVFVPLTYLHSCISTIASYESHNGLVNITVDLCIGGKAHNLQESRYKEV